MHKIQCIEATVGTTVYRRIYIDNNEEPEQERRIAEAVQRTTEQTKDE